MRDATFRAIFRDDFEADLTTSLEVQIYIPDNPYSGPYEVTPSMQTQILETEGLSMTQDVVINPIPSNYGRIAWSGAGSVITVY